MTHDFMKMALETLGYRVSVNSHHTCHAFRIQEHLAVSVFVQLVQGHALNVLIAKVKHI